ncbi:hypothetical protein ANTRET_LOCUS10044 [Anthophora retusa]
MGTPIPAAYTTPGSLWVQGSSFILISTSNFYVKCYKECFRRDRAHTEYELAICYGIAFLRHFNLLILLPARHTQVLAPEITVL